MGACNTCANNNRSMTVLKKKEIKSAITHQKLNSLNKYFTEINDPPYCFPLNEDFCQERNFSLNPLSYALIKGKTRSFKYLKETLGAKLEIMEQNLIKQGTSGLKIICELGLLELLEYCIPLYLELNINREAEDSLSVDFTKSVLAPNTNFLTYTPVHIACEKGHINLLHYIYNLFKERDSCPSELSLCAVDEYTGENCPLIASRMGNFSMLKFLHESCQVDFTAVNRRNENCVNVAVSASKKRNLRSYIDCVVYLVEVIRLDVSHKYEETLLMAEYPVLIDFLEKKLNEKGVSVKKCELEHEYQIHRYPQQKSPEEVKLEAHNGSDFNMKALIEEDSLRSKESIISDINASQRNTTPFVSTLIPFHE